MQIYELSATAAFLTFHRHLKQLELAQKPYKNAPFIQVLQIANFNEEAFYSFYL